jgi:hypothetical protein
MHTTKPHLALVVSLLAITLGACAHTGPTAPVKPPGVMQEFACASTSAERDTDAAYQAEAIARAEQEARAADGPVDSPTDAWFTLKAAGHVGRYACANADQSGYREGPSGYEVRTRWYSHRCRPIERKERIFRVTREGQIELLYEGTVENLPDACVVD